MVRLDILTLMVRKYQKVKPISYFTQIMETGGSSCLCSENQGLGVTIVNMNMGSSFLTDSEIVSRMKT